jgi:hypothetical protein
MRCPFKLVRGREQKCHGCGTHGPTRLSQDLKAVVHKKFTQAARVSVQTCPLTCFWLRPCRLYGAGNRLKSECNKNFSRGLVKAFALLLHSMPIT